MALLRSELEAMLPREIEARAAAMGIMAESLDKAKDQNDVKKALIRIVIGHAAEEHGRAGRGAEAVRGGHRGPDGAAGRLSHEHANNENEPGKPAEGNG